MYHTGALVATDDMPVVAMASMPFSLACMLTLGIITYTSAVCDLEAPVATYTDALFKCWMTIVLSNCVMIAIGSRGNIFQRKRRVPGAPNRSLPICIISCSYDAAAPGTRAASDVRHPTNSNSTRA